ncbi:MAG: hypothetical protein M3409_01010 [Gemmatimonadota bacterium]|jgi:hypothetical protein|nr:hypothetical protein [Gemmatimonadota bacterium]
MSRRAELLGAALLGALIWAPGARAQTAHAPVGDTASASRVVYEREAFRYERGGRPDPFRSLLGTEELGVRVEDLTLRGVIYNPEAGLSVAVLWDEAAKRRIRLRTGERVAGITVVGIYPRRVDVRVDEFGVSRRETLYLRTRIKQDPDSVKGN